VIKSLGGSTQLPMTVIVDADGKIVYNKVGSVTLDVPVKSGHFMPTS